MRIGKNGREEREVYARFVGVGIGIRDEALVEVRVRCWDGVLRERLLELGAVERQDADFGNRLCQIVYANIKNRIE